MVPGELPGDPGCPSIWVFGDSHAYGWGVANDQSWPAQLQVTLSGLLGCLLRCNWALPGYNLSQMVDSAPPHCSNRRCSTRLVLIHFEEFDGFPDFDFSNPPSRFLRQSAFLRPLQVLRSFSSTEASPKTPLPARSGPPPEDPPRATREWAKSQKLSVILIAEPEVSSSCASRARTVRCLCAPRLVRSIPLRGRPALHPRRKACVATQARCPATRLR